MSLLVNNRSYVRISAPTIGIVFNRTGTLKHYTLIPLLKDENSGVREQIVIMIEFISKGSGNPQALMVLQPLLMDENRFVKRVATLAIARITEGNEL